MHHFLYNCLERVRTIAQDASISLPLWSIQEEAKVYKVGFMICATLYISNGAARDVLEVAPDGEGWCGEVLAEGDARGTLEAGDRTE